MRYKWTFVFVLGAGLSQSAIAAKYRLVVQPTEMQIARFDRGLRTVDDLGEGSVVRIVEGGEEVAKRGSFALSALNRGGVPFDLGPQHVTAKLADGTPVAIIPYEQLVREEKSKQKWRAFGMALAAGANSMAASDAGYTSGTVHYSGQTYGAYGTGFGGTATYSGYDSAAAQAAQANVNRENRENFARLREANNARMATLGNNLQTTTIDPGQVQSGMIVYELPKAAHASKDPIAITFIVRRGSEEHSFTTQLVPR